MKKICRQLGLAASLIALAAPPLLHASQTLIVGEPSPSGDEATFRDLEHQNAQAVLHLDYAALDRLWSERFVVSSPANTVLANRAAVFDFFHKSPGPFYSSYEKDIDCIIFSGDVTIVMGVETVVARTASMEGQAGHPVRRRYTNIWKRENGAWRLIARQATILPAAASSASEPKATSS
jgi:ketosteroid isomerase-like protein